MRAKKKKPKKSSKQNKHVAFSKDFEEFFRLEGKVSLATLAMLAKRAKGAQARVKFLR
jgi:hypothetical protein